MKTIIALLCLLSMHAQMAFCQLSPTAVSIPMRDGKFLAADVYLPNQSNTFPIVLIQTPYNKNTYKQKGMPLGVRLDLANSDYGFVVLDWRGFYGSASAFSITGDKGQDGYDAIEWISTQSWCDGNVGTWGPSALSNVQFETAYEQHPNHKCAVPQVTMPQTSYDKYYPGGVMEIASLQSLMVLFGSSSFSTVVENPHYNNLWAYVENASLELPLVKIPMLIVGGWYDHNIDFDITLLEMLREQGSMESRDKHKMLIGPWVHGGTGLAHVGSEIQGELYYPLAAGYNNPYEKQFFDFYLRGIQNNWEQTSVFHFYQMGEDVWRNEASFGNTSDSVTLITDENFNLVSTEVTGGTSLKPFTYDPTDPAPTIGGKTLHQDLDQGPYNQQAIIDRSDALYFETDTLESSLVVEGRIKAIVVLQPGAKDTDIALRLVDVYPDGRKMLLDDDIQRMRFRNGYTTNDTSFMNVNSQYVVTIHFDALAITLPAGHKLGLIVNSSNYPKYNRNMNTGGDMYPNDNIDTLVNAQAIENNLIVGGTQGTRLIIPGKFDDASNISTALSSIQYLYPNPSSAQQAVYLTLNANQAKDIVVYDVAGKKVAIETKIVSANTLSISLKNPRSGLYFICDKKGKVMSRWVVGN
jgi:predicted acyl esterase